MNPMPDAASAKAPKPGSLVPKTLAHAIAALAHHDHRGFVFVRPDGTERFCSFREIHAETSRRGAALLARGLVKGDRLALVIPDGDEFVLSFLGAVMAGVVPVPMYPQLSFKNVESYHDTVAHITRASGAKALLTTAATRAYVEPVLGKVPTLGNLWTVDELASTAAPSALTPGPSPSSGRGESRDSTLSRLAGEGRGEGARVDGEGRGEGGLENSIEPSDLAFLQFTSGSTSRPKGVMVTHANLAANSEAFMIHGLGKDSSFDKGVSWLPLFHDMGLIGFVIGPLFTDIPVVFLPTASFVRSPRVWLDTIHKHRGTITYAPNFAFALVSKRIKEKDIGALDLSCMRITGCGAEPIQPKTLREFSAKLAPAGFNPKSLIPSYGMAEATLAITFSPHGQGMHTDTIDAKALQAREARPYAGADAEGGTELVSCGTPFPGHELKIVDDDGRQLGERQVGQILTRGPSVAAGYYQEDELTRGCWKDGWLYTGDLGYLEGGRLYICGRIKDIIIIRGRNFYPQDIEWVASELPGVRRGNVVAFSLEVEGEERLVVCAEAFQADAAGLTEAISGAVTEKLGLSVHRVEIVPQGTLPRTSSGKPQRRKTKQMLLDGTLRRGTASAVVATAEEAASTDSHALGDSHEL
jgi:fatty-acyl-CoA synthase